ncbi:transcriptional regulator [Mycobacterium kubicae]|uniref:Helix-turn-helix domain-containing protein n=1 Tax=Mycobacterium kubicae TaxID=120959 RepID=A0AAX1J5X2_9MYCO|nr:helix-turn-helix transcriptional regulator [Mycobacterium kubicae]MCV7097670.1 helix-turn-helix domain-containing protein [Mycobacterium kubicae]ORW04086.1 XRE family transcriptional regulator [Mycobacterium kubicae]QNI12371.1 helix-turn-helix domain-containing protein [Mycobacterium kubicae]QPI35890.1 helix-turn-helix domain-containing protein [Mycobacterium kubicae]GFG65387.1 transcriptional regulator [Mycobacterium kubicae]
MTFGELLRLWRDRLSPQEVGLTVALRRRAPGLRREELATLAGISVDYLLRLEQGRSSHPSPSVVASLARALQLSRSERDQLFASAGLLPPRDGTIDTYLPPGIQRLVRRLSDIPCAVFSADWTLQWWNDMWVALAGDPAQLPPRERNVARAIFGDGPARALLTSSHSPAAVSDGTFENAILADLKAASARYPLDPGLSELVRELRTVSTDFDERWRAASPAVHTTQCKTIRHPEVGEIRVDCDVLDIPGADLHLVTYTAAADSSDAGKLELLRVTRGVTIS